MIRSALFPLRAAAAQIVTPPKGLEIGYVPIATRQEWDNARRPAK